MKLQLQVNRADAVGVYPDRDAAFEISAQTLARLVSLGPDFLLEHYPNIQTPLPRLVRVGDHSFLVAYSEYEWFWRLVEKACWEPQTYRVFDRYLDKDTTYMDVGTWIGPTLLYAAQLSRRAVGFEPDPTAFKQAKTNLNLNKGAPWADAVTLDHRAIMPESGIVDLGAESEQGQSSSSILFAGKECSWKAESVSFAAALERLDLEPGDKLFVKMDIEGAEYLLAPAMTESAVRYRFGLLLSLHPHFLHQSLKQEIPGKSPLKRILRRKAYYLKHKQLLNSLPHPYIYTCEGVLLTRTSLLRDCLLRGRFPSELLFQWSPAT